MPDDAPVPLEPNAVPIAAFASAPPRGWSVVLTLFAATLVLEDNSRQVSPSARTFCLAPLIALVAVGNYLVRLLSARWPAFRPRHFWRWAALPVMVLVVVSAFVWGWPMQVRFALSQPAFERALAEVQRSGPWTRPRWVGLFPVYRVDIDGDKVHFVVGDSVIDPVAISHDPRRQQDHYSIRRIKGSWFATEQ